MVRKRPLPVFSDGPITSLESFSARFQERVKDPKKASAVLGELAGLIPSDGEEGVVLAKDILACIYERGLDPRRNHWAAARTPPLISWDLLSATHRKKNLCSFFNGLPLEIRRNLREDPTFTPLLVKYGVKWVPDGEPGAVPNGPQWMEKKDPKPREKTSRRCSRIGKGQSHSFILRSIDRLLGLGRRGTAR